MKIKFERTPDELKAIAELRAIGCPEDEINHYTIWNYIWRDKPERKNYSIDE